MNYRLEDRIGEIYYSSLQEGDICREPAVNVYYNSQSLPPFSFQQLKGQRVEKNAITLASSLEKIVPHLINNYSPLFTDLDDILKEVFCKRTFIEDRKSFRETYGRGTYSVAGYFNNKPRKSSSAGSHIKNSGSQKEFTLTILHEYGHEFLYRSCEHDLTRNNYRDYDEVMHEVFAILTGRQFKRSLYDTNPHRKARSLIRKLEKINLFNSQQFSQKWRELLPFTDHRQLAEYIKILRRPLGITFK